MEREVLKGRGSEVWGELDEGKSDGKGGDGVARRGRGMEGVDEDRKGQLSEKGNAEMAVK